MLTCRVSGCHGADPASTACSKLSGWQIPTGCACPLNLPCRRFHSALLPLSALMM